MIRLTINGIALEATEGALLIDAIKAAGVSVPTLCYLREIGALTSCMICVVKEVTRNRLIPACATKVEDGMILETDTPEVRAARRSVLRMLLNEHAGDCEGPCARICPAGLNIPRMLRHQAAGEAEAAARLARRDLIFPVLLSHLCSAPCERVCRRAPYDAPVAIRRMHGLAAEAYLPIPEGWEKAGAASGKNVAIIGAGLAAFSAAAMLRRMGHDCRLYTEEKPLDALTALPETTLPKVLLDAEIAAVQAMGITIHTGALPDAKELLQSCDALIIAGPVAAPSHPRVFHAEEEAMYVRSVGNGKEAARSIDALFKGSPIIDHEKRFNSTLNKVLPEELISFAVGRKQEHTSATAPSDNPVEEAARCLHCDCLKLESCKLRRYAEEYGLAPQIKRTMERPPLYPLQQTDAIQLEPGKCIKCGLCVEITAAAGVSPGMSITGRGLASIVQPAFGASLAEGLGAVAQKCVQACPTAALAFRDKEESL